MEGDDELQECWWTSNPVQEIKEAGSADEIKCLGQINKGKIKGASLFTAFFL